MSPPILDKLRRLLIYIAIIPLMVVIAVQLLMADNKEPEE
jgi:hypothetical protein